MQIKKVALLGSNLKVDTQFLNLFSDIKATGV